MYLHSAYILAVLPRMYIGIRLGYIWVLTDCFVLPSSIIGVRRVSTSSIIVLACWRVSHRGKTSVSRRRTSGKLLVCTQRKKIRSLVLLWVKKFPKLTEGICVVKSEFDNHRWFPGLLQNCEGKNWNSGKFSFWENFDRNWTIWQNAMCLSVTPVSSVSPDSPVPYCVNQQWVRQRLTP